MENTRRVSLHHGPRAGRAPARRISAPRRAILNKLQDQPEPVTLASLVRLTRLHENTIREHLNALVLAGQVVRHRAAPAGRGRPAWLYGIAGEDHAISEYAGLAATLARTIVRESAEPVEAATRSGEEWGHDLARSRGAERSSPEDAQRAVVTLMTDLGFDPQGTGSPEVVDLTRCPLLEAAHKHSDVVCAVHVGLVRGALEEHGADPTGTELYPFSEPNACRLVIPPRSGGEIDLTSGRVGPAGSPRTARGPRGPRR